MRFFCLALRVIGHYTDKELHSFLEENFERYNRPDFIKSDPISIPHLFSKKQDIEIAGFLTATIAWGQRPTIIKNANELMNRMDMAPHDFIMNHTKKDLLQFKNFKHRTFNGIDCTFFLRSLQNIYRKHKSMEDVFSPLSLNNRAKSEGWERSSGVGPVPIGASGGEAKEAITNFRKTFFSIPHPQRIEKHVSNPEANSSSKRLNMFLRWMVRKDKCGVDFGIWNNIKMSELMCPLDVHSGNVARKLGLLHRKQNDWQSVEELTSRLRVFDRKDPAKYDFALFGLGVFEKY
jgi:uncharacterized protein (TIGR02757 family)